MDNLNFQTKILLADILGTDLTDLIIKKKVPNSSQKILFEKKLSKLKEGYPLDYLLNKTEIKDMHWKLRPGVLIPRLETTHLLDLIVKLRKKQTLKKTTYLEGLEFFENTNNRIKHKTITLLLTLFREKNLSLLDLGCGSGFIGLSLSNCFKKTVLTDVSPFALKIAKQNQLLNKIRNVSFYKSNLLKNTNLIQKIKQNKTLLICNPPYLPYYDKLEAKTTNTSKEPSLALYAGHNGLKIFNKLMCDLKKIKNNTPLVIFELDPRNIKTACKISKQTFKHQLILKDFNNLNRFLFLWH
jgi:release factor glutamine methyltransferase